MVARSFYQKYLGFLMAPSPNWFAAALFGLITCVTYDLTNLAILKDWAVLLSIVDMLWGTFLSVSVSVIGFIAGKRLS